MAGDDGVAVYSVRTECHTVTVRGIHNITACICTFFFGVLSVWNQTTTLECLHTDLKITYFEQRSERKIVNTA